MMMVPRTRTLSLTIDLKFNDRIMIVGVTGSGKSELMRHLLKSYRDQGINYIIYDSQHQHGDLASYAEGEHENFVYQPKEVDSIEEFETICRSVWRRRNLVFAIENLDFYSTPQKPQSPTFKKLVHLGRMKGIGLIMTTRRIADVHKSPCSQVRHWFIFRTFLPNDVKYLRQFIGDTADQAMKLEEHEFIYWSFNKVKICPPIRIDG